MHQINAWIIIQNLWLTAKRQVHDQHIMEDVMALNLPEAKSSSDTKHLFIPQD